MDTYRFARGDGRDVIQEGNDSASIDQLLFEFSGAGAISYDQLWFTSSNGGRDLTVSVLGTQDSVTLQGAFGGTGAGVERIGAADLRTSDPNDVKTLSASGLQQLVAAMATIAPASGATSWSNLNTADQRLLKSLGVWQ